METETPEPSGQFNPTTLILTVLAVVLAIVAGVILT
jgi:hypothetical protein